MTDRIQTHWIGCETDHHACALARLDEARARIAMLEEALRGLHDDVADYQRINNLGGYDNHWMRIARAALGEGKG